MRNSTENIYQEKANLVIDYISAHLHHPLQLNKIAEYVHVSQRQLLRIMHSFLQEPLYTYIARQRIERAVLYMQTEQMNLDRLAGMVGYDNPQSFSKAFKKQFGISPKTYMKELQARLEKYVKSAGNKYDDIQHFVSREEELDLVYIRIFGKYGEKEPYETAWGKLVDFLKNKGALSPDTRFIGISFDDPNVTHAAQCRFYACASVSKKITTTGEFGTIRIPAGTYAVYTVKGSYSQLKEIYNRMNFTFASNIRLGMSFEEYVNNPYDTAEENLLTKIYIPIKD